MNRQPHFREYIRLPGVITLLALAAGWTAIALLISGLPFLAVAVIAVAFLIDCLDGYVARKLHQESEFGKQLDGTVDFLNYSVFSALLFWMYVAPNWWGAVISFVILGAGAVRLVRNNLEGLWIKNGVGYYSGIVVCHVLLTAVGLFFIGKFYPQLAVIVVPPIMLVVSILQLSRIPIPKSKSSYWFGLSIAFIILVVSLVIHLWNR
jgi:CDP-diacylglycerol--serine O-phosphatidyltransferase